MQSVNKQSKSGSMLQPPSCSQSIAVHTAIAIATVTACYAYCTFVDVAGGLQQIGVATESPILFILVLSQLLHCLVNKYILVIHAHTKEQPMLGVNTKSKRSGGGGATTTVGSLFRAALLLGVAVALIAAVCILFGAPILSDHLETATLAATIVTLTVAPFVLYLGATGTLQYLFCEGFELSAPVQRSYLDAIHASAVFTLLGAWASSVVMPLDWDRSWQTYPIPNMCGAIGGHLLGSAYNLAAVACRQWYRTDSLQKKD